MCKKSLFEFEFARSLSSCAKLKHHPNFSWVETNQNKTKNTTPQILIQTRNKLAAVTLLKQQHPKQVKFVILFNGLAHKCPQFE